MAGCGCGSSRRSLSVWVVEYGGDARRPPSEHVTRAEAEAALARAGGVGTVRRVVG
ncbi:MAG: hypothetical protein JXA67_18770 [Micromonosporaceae bacterium]|nr:hypothetical protein [Micromonosporaceae bacterium]